MHVNLHGGGADFCIRFVGRLSSLQKCGSSLQKMKSRSMRRGVVCFCSCRSVVTVCYNAMSMSICMVTTRKNMVSGYTVE